LAKRNRGYDERRQADEASKRFHSPLHDERSGTSSMTGAFATVVIGHRTAGCGVARSFATSGKVDAIGNVDVYLPN
jgi:hypothetical protein